MQRLSVVRCNSFVTRGVAEFEATDELAGHSTYCRDLKQRLYRNAAKHPEMKTIEVFICAIREKKLCREDFVILSGLNLHFFIRYGTNVTTSPAILLCDTWYNQSQMRK